ncbi:hypothetical protein JCM9279_007499 [Rhodotorula babjevae]
MSTSPALHLVEHGADRLPRHPSPHHTSLARLAPSALVEAWLRAPAATAFKRRDLSRVETSGVGHNLFVHEPRHIWQQAYIEVNDDVASLRHAQRPLAPLEFDVDGRTLAKIDNWMALVPLDHVLLTFDKLFDHPALFFGANPAHRELEMFVRLLIDLGLVPNRDNVTLSGRELVALSQWLAQHCPVAVELWRYTFAHIYSNAREAAGSTEAWHEQLKAVRFPAGGSGSAWVLYVRHLEGLTVRAPKVDEGHYFEETGPLGVASFVELYLELHPDRDQLLENATSTNRTPRLPLLENSLAKYEPVERSSRAT